MLASRGSPLNHPLSPESVQILYILPQTTCLMNMYPGNVFLHTTTIIILANRKISLDNLDTDVSSQTCRLDFVIVEARGYLGI